MKTPFILSLGSALCAVSASCAGGVCTVRSGPATAALVELYTSEGCSSCPPADQQLSRLRRQLDADAVVVPLALHVSYWDQIGWKDVFAQKTFDDRQRGLLEKRRNKVVYTPQFFVNGEELRDWSKALPASIRQANATQAPVAISLTSSTLASGTAPGTTLLIEADVAATDPRSEGVLYLALTESGLVSHVLRGENSGATLRHDNTVRLWLGPIPLAHGTARLREKIVLPAAWRSEQVQAAAFVQGPDARILQAVSTERCLPAAPAGKLSSRGSSLANGHELLASPSNLPSPKQPPHG